MTAPLSAYASEIYLQGMGGIKPVFTTDTCALAARAAAELGLPMVLSTVSSYSLEDVAAANSDGARWFQLHWPNDEQECLKCSRPEVRPGSVGLSRRLAALSWSAVQQLLGPSGAARSARSTRCRESPTRSANASRCFSTQVSAPAPTS